MPDEADDIRERVVDIVAEYLEVNKEVLRGADSDFLKEVGADSLDLVELVMELEQKLE